MKLNLTTPDGDVVWVDISKAIVIKSVALGEGTEITFGMERKDYIIVQETMKEISGRLPGGLHNS